MFFARYNNVSLRTSPVQTRDIFAPPLNQTLTVNSRCESYLGSISPRLKNQTDHRSLSQLFEINMYVECAVDQSRTRKNSIYLETIEEFGDQIINWNRNIRH